jgi:tetratricopeptide (TPR) repeat protein
MTYDEALSLFRRGRFCELISAYHHGQLATAREASLRVLVAYVAAHTDDVSTATQLLSPIAGNQSTAAVRSQTDATLGLLSWRSGDFDNARQHFQSAVRHGRASHDDERTAWAYLHLFRFLLEAQPAESLTATLGEVRAAVIRAGVPYLTAYLHVCVATLEGQRGRLEESLRHCDIAESLLELQPNAWVLGASLINRACIACFQCDFNLALKLNQAAIELASTNGSIRNRLAAQVTSAHILMLSGQYDEAEQLLSVLLTDPKIDGIRAISAADTLARLYLAVGNVDKCDEILSRINFSFHVNGNDSIYVKRWAALTRTKLLLRRGEHKSAAVWLERVQMACRVTGDSAFEAASQLLLSESASHESNEAECCRHLLAAHDAGIRRQTDFQGQLNYSLSRFTRITSPELVSRLIHQRATARLHTQTITQLTLLTHLPQSLTSPLSLIWRQASVCNW